MDPEIQTTTKVSRGWMFWLGWVLSILPCLLLIMSAVMKFVQPTGFDQGMAHMGWPVEKAPTLGMIELACTAIYLFPKTAMLGAILLAAYMGGAVATHVRVGDPFFIQILVGVFLWLGLWLRDARLRELTPLRS